MGIEVLNSLANDFLQLLFPRLCPGCGSLLNDNKTVLCLSCLDALPRTGFAGLPDNPVERIFAGRCRLAAGHAEFYFSKGHTVQRLIHRLKYKGDSSAGIFLGRQIAGSVIHAGRFRNAELLIPVPLFKSREKQRGYNQATLLCKGISQLTGIPVCDDNLIRKKATETQTRKDRTARWLNVEGSFELCNPGLLNGRHLVLVDDVVTTGASLEACCRVLETARPAGISIILAAIASK